MNWKWKNILLIGTNFLRSIYKLQILKSNIYGRSLLAEHRSSRVVFLWEIVADLRLDLHWDVTSDTQYVWRLSVHVSIILLADWLLESNTLLSLLAAWWPESNTLLSLCFRFSRSHAGVRALRLNKLGYVRASFIFDRFLIVILLHIFWLNPEGLLLRRVWWLNFCIEWESFWLYRIFSWSPWLNLALVLILERSEVLMLLVVLFFGDLFDLSICL